MGELYSWLLGLRVLSLHVNAGERMRSGSCKLMLAMRVDMATVCL